LRKVAAQLLVSQDLIDAVGDRVGSCGSTGTAASPATSGCDDTFDVTTGVPLAIASAAAARPLRRATEDEHASPAISPTFLPAGSREADVV
jgi:hypothetical protein